MFKHLLHQQANGTTQMINFHNVFDKEVAKKCSFDDTAPVFLEDTHCFWTSLHFFRINAKYAENVGFTVCKKGDVIAGYWKDTKFTRCLYDHGVRVKLYNRAIVWDLLYFGVIIFSFIAYVIFILKHFVSKAGLIVNFTQNIGQFGLPGLVIFLCLVTVISILSVSVYSL